MRARCKAVNTGGLAGKQAGWDRAVWDKCGSKQGVPCQPLWDTSMQGMRWQDMTNTLRLGVWPSFNRPYFRDIYEKAGCAWRCPSTREYL